VHIFSIDLEIIKISIEKREFYQKWVSVVAVMSFFQCYELSVSRKKRFTK